ncbi:MAG: alpha/beta hydrolase [Betaproteobacteria bacterium]
MRPSQSLILLPGTLMDASSLRPLAAALDRPAHIELLGVKDDFNAEIDRLAALAMPSTVWIGHSLGGIAALHLAARRPECCAALVVIASNVRPDGPLGAHNRTQQWAALSRGGMAALLRQQLAPVYGIQDDDPLIDQLQAQAQTVGAERYRRQLRYAAERPGLLHGMSTLRMPVLALSGGDDPLCPPECAEEIIARSLDARSRHRVLPGAGHLLPLQAPDWCTQQIRDFLAPLA